MSFTICKYSASIRSRGVIKTDEISVDRMIKRDYTELYLTKAALQLKKGGYHAIQND